MIFLVKYTGWWDWLVDFLQCFRHVTWPISLKFPPLYCCSPTNNRTGFKIWLFVWSDSGRAMEEILSWLVMWQVWYLASILIHLCTQKRRRKKGFYFFLRQRRQRSITLRAESAFQTFAFFLFFLICTQFYIQLVHKATLSSTFTIWILDGSLFWGKKKIIKKMLCNF